MESLYYIIIFIGLLLLVVVKPFTKPRSVEQVEKKNKEARMNNTMRHL